MKTIDSSSSQLSQEIFRIFPIENAFGFQVPIGNFNNEMKKNFHFIPNKMKLVKIWFFLDDLDWRCYKCFMKWKFRKKKKILEYILSRSINYFSFKISKKNCDFQMFIGKIRNV